MDDELDNRTEQAQIAVTVIGGYLGAGKTTLVNHVLRTADERVAVLVNDFGDVDIDADLIESADGDTISLANGCICCSLVDGFAAALDTIRGLETRPERLVIEASGVADPATVAAYGHSNGLTLDAVVVVVDAETIRAKAKDRYVGDTVMAQLRSADVLVLNKVDLVAADDLAAARDWLAASSPDAVITETTGAAVDHAVLFGVVAEPVVLARSDEAKPPSPHAEHAVDELFESWSWSGSGPIERSSVETLMADLPDSVVRAKGVFDLADEPDRSMVLQRVGRRWSLRPGGPWRGEPASRLAVIGLAGAIDQAFVDSRLD